MINDYHLRRIDGSGGPNPSLNGMNSGIDLANFGSTSVNTVEPVNHNRALEEVEEWAIALGTALQQQQAISHNLEVELKKVLRAT